MWICMLDGLEVREFATELEAEQWCVNYDGDKNPSYEYVPLGMSYQISRELI